MSDNGIIIRPAELSDSESIYQILLVDCKNWSIEKIKDRIKDLFVLAYQNKILGVFCGNASSNKFEPYWVSVHPMYPESSITAAIYHALLGVFKRQPSASSALNLKK
jgi:hypothetical protein